MVLPAFKVDATAPETVFTGGPSGVTRSPNATFNLGAAEAGATFECSLDAGAWQSCSSPVSYGSLADGAHSFAVRSTDVAGNVDATPATRTWTVDASVPGVTLDTPADASATNDSTPTLSGAAGTAAGDSNVITVKVYAGAGATGTPVQVRTVGATSGSWTTVPASALADGTYTARAEQADNVGSGTSEEHSFTVDTVAPRVRLIAPIAGTSTSDPIPAIRGIAGTSPGDADSVTIDLYTGSTTSGDPIQTQVATPSDDGLWSITPTQLAEGA